jgi:hypothetical protein
MQALNGPGKGWKSDPVHKSALYVSLAVVRLAHLPFPQLVQRPTSIEA